MRGLLTFSTGSVIYASQRDTFVVTLI